LKALRARAPALLLAVIALLACAAAGLWWWAGTDGSLQWALRRAASSQPLTVEDASGTLRTGLRVKRLTWEREGLKIQAEDVDLAWQPLFLFGGTVKLSHFHAAALSIVDSRPPTNEPWTLPNSLAIRPDVELDDLAIGRIEWVTNKAIIATNLAGRYWYAGAAHALRLDSVHWAGGTYSAAATLGARGTLPLDATISGKLETQVPGSAEKIPVEFAATLRGPLADLQVEAKVHSTRADVQATEATATARVTLWAAQPVPQAQVDMSGLDLAGLWPQAPHTQLAGQVRVTPAGTATWQATANVRNEMAGPWDQRKLPVSHFRAQGQWRGGMALVRELDARIGAGQLKATGEWRSGNAGWTLHGNVANVDPAALHTQFAATPIGGKIEVRQDGSAIAFDVGLQGNGGAAKPAAGQRGVRGKPTVRPVAIRQLAANGRWANGRLSLPSLAIRTSDASLQGSLEVEPAARSGSGKLVLQAPGLRGNAEGALSETRGRGKLLLEGSDLTLAGRWLQALPGLSVAANAPPVAGRASLSVAWQGGWNDPQVQARLSSPAVEVRTGGDDKAPTWNVTQLVATLNGRLSEAALAVQARAKQGQRHVDLQLAGRGGRAPVRRGAVTQWRANIATLSINVQDPAIGTGAWQLALRRAVDLLWSPGGQSLDVTSGQATLSSPAVKGAAAPAQALLAWDPVRWRAGELRTAGRLTGLPMGWIELVGGPQLAGSALSGDMVFDAQWDASLGRTLKLNASLARSRGDVTVLAETAEGASSRVPAGVRDARLTLVSQGEEVVLALRWDSERAGVAEGRLATRLAPGGATGWQWPDNAPISGALRARLPRIGVWSLLAPPGWRLRGSLAADVKAAGTRADLQLSGTVAADDLALRSVVDGVELQGGRLRARLEGNRVLLTEFILHGAGERDGGGTLSATGEAAWIDKAPRVRMTARLTKLRASIRSDRQLTVSGQLESQLDASSTQIRGSLKVDQARIVLPEETAPKLGDDVVVRNTAAMGATAQERAAKPPAAAPASPAKRPLVVAVDLDLGDDFQVEGRGLRTRLRGSLALSGQSIAQPQLVGAINTVGGEYRAYGQRLDVERGVLRFSGRIDNPTLDILAVRPNLVQRVGVLITGDAQAPFVRLYAEPDLPDAEKLAWLVTGRAAPSTGAEAALVQQAALALLASRRPGAKGLAATVGLDELSVRRDGSEGAVVTLGKRFARNFYASYERSLSGALGTLYIFYDVSRRLTVRAQAGERAGVDLIFTFAFD
jgi:translocation and assembly module TamB